MGCTARALYGVSVPADIIHNGSTREMLRNKRDTQTLYVDLLTSINQCD